MEKLKQNKTSDRMKINLTYYSNLSIPIYEGIIEVRCDSVLWGTSFRNFSCYFPKSSQEQNKQKIQLIRLLQENFSSMYEKILKELYNWQEKGILLEYWDEKTACLKPIRFHKKEEIHPYLGEPVITLLDREKESYIGLEFWKSCTLSIEHGITALFSYTELLWADAANSEETLDAWLYYNSRSKL